MVNISEILIGLYHYPHINFFKEAINKLENKGHKCSIFLRQRSNLFETAKFELERDDITLIGEHRSSNFGKFFEFLKSLILLFFYFANNRPKIAASIGGQELCLISYLFGVKVLSFNDDPGHGIVFKITSKTATELIIPKAIKYQSKNCFHYPSYKELAHLHPTTFSPNDKILLDYNLKKYSYILFREQDSVSMVYRNTSVGDFKSVIRKLDKTNTNFVFSLEKKTEIDFYKKRGIVLKEPVKDFHSLV